MSQHTSGEVTMWTVLVRPARSRLWLPAGPTIAGVEAAGAKSTLASTVGRVKLVKTHVRPAIPSIAWQHTVQWRRCIRRGTLLLAPVQPTHYPG
eukprot:scaffold53471_cov92-Phaeocystis_antarctica.AAC.2